MIPMNAFENASTTVWSTHFPPISLLLLHLPKSFSHTSPLLLPPASERLVELHKREALIELRID